MLLNSHELLISTVLSRISSAICGWPKLRRICSRFITIPLSWRLINRAGNQVNPLVLLLFTQIQAQVVVTYLMAVDTGFISAFLEIGLVGDKLFVAQL